jgi:hypothetical protein
VCVCVCVCVCVVSSGVAASPPQRQRHQRRSWPWLRSATLRPSDNATKVFLTLAALGDSPPQRQRHQRRSWPWPRSAILRPSDNATKAFLVMAALGDPPSQRQCYQALLLASPPSRPPFWLHPAKAFLPAGAAAPRPPRRRPGATAPHLSLRPALSLLASPPQWHSCLPEQQQHLFIYYCYIMVH